MPDHIPIDPQLIDRVARAIQDHDLIGGSSYWCWDALHPERQAELIDMARAAIDAMPGPLEYDLPQSIALDKIRAVLITHAESRAGYGIAPSTLHDDLQNILDAATEPRHD